MGKDKFEAKVNDPIMEELPDMTDYEKDPMAGEVDIEPMEIVHTPMGTTVKPAKFGMGEQVRTNKEVDLGNTIIPEGFELTIMRLFGDDVYGCTGPEGLSVSIKGEDLEKRKE